MSPTPGEGGTVIPGGIDADLLVAIDELARTWLAEVPHVRFALAASDDERAAYYRLRYDVIIEREWATPDELPAGLEVDEYDERAIHLLGFEGDTLVTAARLVLPSMGALLPTEEFFDIRIAPIGQVANVDRMLVAPGYRDGRSALFRALMARCWLELRRRGFVVWAGIHTLFMVRLYRRLGFEVQILGGSKIHWGAPRFPVRFEPKDAVIVVRGEPNAWRARWSGDGVGDQGGTG